MSQIITSEFAARTDLHITRKIWHMGMGSMVFLLYIKTPALEREPFVWIALAVAFLAFLVDFWRLRNEKVNSACMKVLRPIVRKSEVRGYTGVPFFALGVAVSLAFFEERIALLSILFLIFADPLASAVGIKYGEDKIFENKSLQGTVTCFAVCYVLTLAVGLYIGNGSVELLTFALLAGMMGAVSELMSVWVDDNFSIPVVSGLGLTLLNFGFQIF